MLNKEYLKKYREKYPERFKKYHKDYYEKNKDKIKVKIANYQRIAKRKLRTEIIRLLGDKCVRCSYNDIRALQIDHVYGGGRRKYSHGRHNRYYYSTILKKISHGSKDYQLLCANCNWIKRFENNEIYLGEKNESSYNRN